ncbi:MAG TPA: alpha/beta hydrolase, partial [Dehalococcoidia bacterium]|nr:alpha/beta hydrolase [Dehalococcoidia bacterium]
MLTRRFSYDPAGMFEVETSDVEFRRVGDLPLLARVYRPRGAGPFPLLIDVHGGAWCKGDRLNNEPMDTALAASGLVVAAIDFRLGPDHPYPASIADVNYGIRWLKVHAVDFGAVADRLGALGSSSGGHQVLLNALRPRDPRYAADPIAAAPEVDASLAYVIACWPVIDPYARYLFARETGREDLAEMSEGYFRTVE